MMGILKRLFQTWCKRISILDEIFNVISPIQNGINLTKSLENNTKSHKEEHIKTDSKKKRSSIC